MEDFIFGCCLSCSALPELQRKPLHVIGVIRLVGTVGPVSPRRAWTENTPAVPRYPKSHLRLGEGGWEAEGMGRGGAVVEEGNGARLGMDWICKQPCRLYADASGGVWGRAEVVAGIRHSRRNWFCGRGGREGVVPICCSHVCRHAGLLVDLTHI